MRSAIGVVLAALVGVSTAAAQDVKRLEPVVVTATKIDTPQERLGAAVTVITEEEIRGHHYESVGDALRQVPGLEVQRSGGPGKLTSVRIRGATSNQIQVLVDGVRVKSPTTGQFDFSDVAPEQIERIEIVRGPQSTLHGADAIGGVIHIITKRGQGPPSGTASVEAGTHDAYRARAGVSGGHTIFDYAFGGSWHESGGSFRNDQSEQRAASARLGVRLPANGHLSLSARYNRTSTDLPVDRAIATKPLFVLDPDAQQQSETATVSLQWKQKPVDWYELSARASQFWNQVGFQDPLTAGLDFAATVSQINTRRGELEAVNHFHFRDLNTLSLGAEHREEGGRNRHTFRKHVNVNSWFLQDEIRLFDRLFLSGGRRWEDNDAFGHATTHRAGLAAVAKETGTRLRGTWGEGFRAPTLNDLFFPGFGNTDLRPERSESWDAGLDQRLWQNRIRLGATYFENRFDDLIQFALVGGQFLPVNVARARSEGVEFTAEIDLLDNLLFTANYTHTESADLGARRPLRRVAPDRGNFGLSWDLIPALNLFAQVHVTSSQFEAIGFPRNPGHNRVDVGGTYRILERRGPWPGLEATLRIQNLTDQRYGEVLGFRALGVNALAGLQARY